MATRDTTGRETRVADSKPEQTAASFFKTALEYEDYKIGSSSGNVPDTKLGVFAHGSSGTLSDQTKPTKRQSNSSSDPEKTAIRQSNSSPDPEKTAIRQSNSSADPEKTGIQQSNSSADPEKTGIRQSNSSANSKRAALKQSDYSEQSSQTMLTRITPHLRVKSPIHASVVKTGDERASTTLSTPPSSKMLSLFRREKSTASSQEGDTGAGNMMQLIKLRNIARNVKNIQHDRQQRLENTGNETIYIKFRKFNHKEAEGSMRDVLESSLKHVVYEPKRCKILSLHLSDRIRNSMKQLQFPRYKFVSFVTIGQKGTQDVVIASRCVWNTDDDSYASVRFENQTLFATAVVFALLQE